MNTTSHQNVHNRKTTLTTRVETVPAEGTVALQQEQHLRMRDATGWTIKAVTGTIWITQESDSRDIILKAGDSFVLDRPGSTLVSPLGDAKLCLKREGLTQAGKTHRALSTYLPSFSAARGLFA